MDDDQELYDLSNIFLQIPWEYSGMGMPTGKKYEAIRDFLKDNKYKPKEWTSIIVSMGQIWVQNIPKQNSE